VYQSSTSSFSSVLFVWDTALGFPSIAVFRFSLQATKHHGSRLKDQNPARDTTKGLYIIKHPRAERVEYVTKGPQIRCPSEENNVKIISFDENS
jgi:hypothetical protein